MAEALGSLVNKYTYNKNNVNVKSKDLNNVNNVNVKTQKVRAIAEKLASKFDDNQNLLFYLKCAWKLSEAELWRQVEVATTKRTPRNYFAKVCKAIIEERSLHTH